MSLNSAIKIFISFIIKRERDLFIYALYTFGRKARSTVKVRARRFTTTH
jgi:hypothetical protein